MSSFQGNIALGIAALVSFVLALGKGAVFLFSGSAAVLASSLDSAFDAILSLMNFLVLRQSEKPPDAMHRFGHGKFEAFAALAQALILFVSGLLLCAYSLYRFLYQIPLDSEKIGILVMTIALIVTVLVSLFLRRAFHKTGSLVIQSDLTHYVSDVFAHGAVILSLFLNIFFPLPAIDAALGCFFGLLIFRLAYGLFQEAFDVLTDKEIPMVLRKKIVDILNAAVGKTLQGWHLLRTRRVGSAIHIDGHLVFDDQISLREAHEISEILSQEITRALPRSVVLFHSDPYDDSPKGDDLLE